jgi:cytochrome P450
LASRPLLSWIRSCPSSPFDDSETFSKNPIHDRVMGKGGGKRLLIPRRRYGGGPGLDPLALFPDWQEWARQEVLKVAGIKAIGRKHLERHPLVEAIFQEAMRLYAPPDAEAVRATKQGHDIRPNATIAIRVYVVRCHERLWSEPPLKRNLGVIAAPICPLAEGGVLRWKTMLATLLASARLELPEAEVPELLARITLRPRAGLKLKTTMLS